LLQEGLLYYNISSSQPSTPRKYRRGWVDRGAPYHDALHDQHQERHAPALEAAINGHIAEGHERRQGRAAGGADSEACESSSAPKWVEA
jgi:hypothetical protein